MILRKGLSTYRYLSFRKKEKTFFFHSVTESGCWSCFSFNHLSISQYNFNLCIFYKSKAKGGGVNNYLVIYLILIKLIRIWIFKRKRNVTSKRNIKSSLRLLEWISCGWYSQKWDIYLYTHKFCKHNFFIIFQFIFQQLKIYYIYICFFFLKCKRILPLCFWTTNNKLRIHFLFSFG